MLVTQPLTKERVLTHLGLHPDADIVVASGALDGGLAPHLQPNARVELERVAPAGDLRVAVDHAHLCT